MAGTYGSRWQAQILKHQLGQTLYTQQTYWVSLCNSTCWTAAGSDSVSEVSAGGGYARYPIGTNSFFEAVTVPTLFSGAIATNTSTLTISAGTTSNWGDIGWIRIMDTSTIGAGNTLAWCTAAATRTVLTGDQVLIAAGSLSIQLGP